MDLGPNGLGHPLDSIRFDPIRFDPIRSDAIRFDPIRLFQCSYFKFLLKIHFQDSFSNWLLKNLFSKLLFKNRFFQAAFKFFFFNHFQDFFSNWLLKISFSKLLSKIAFQKSYSEFLSKIGDSPPLITKQISSIKSS